MGPVANEGACGYLYVFKGCVPPSAASQNGYDSHSPDSLIGRLTLWQLLTAAWQRPCQTWDKTNMLNMSKNERYKNQNYFLIMACWKRCRVLFSIDRIHPFAFSLLDCQRNKTRNKTNVFQEPRGPRCLLWKNWKKLLIQSLFLVPRISYIHFLSFPYRSSVAVRSRLVASQWVLGGLGDILILWSKFLLIPILVSRLHGNFWRDFDIFPLFFLLHGFLLDS